jgi:hypothetical protein
MQGPEGMDGTAKKWDLFRRLCQMMLKTKGDGDGGGKSDGMNLP